MDPPVAPGTCVRINDTDFVVIATDGDTFTATVQSQPSSSTMPSPGVPAPAVAAPAGADTVSERGACALEVPNASTTPAPPLGAQRTPLADDADSGSSAPNSLSSRAVTEPPASARHALMAAAMIAAARAQVSATLDEEEALFVRKHLLPPLSQWQAMLRGLLGAAAVLGGTASMPQQDVDIIIPVPIPAIRIVFVGANDVELASHLLSSKVSLEKLSSEELTSVLIPDLELAVSHSGVKKAWVAGKGDHNRVWGRGMAPGAPFVSATLKDEPATTTPHDIVCAYNTLVDAALARRHAWIKDLTDTVVDATAVALRRSAATSVDGLRAVRIVVPAPLSTLVAWKHKPALSGRAYTCVTACTPRLKGDGELPPHVDAMFRMAAAKIGGNPAGALARAYLMHHIWARGAPPDTAAVLAPALEGLQAAMSAIIKDTTNSSTILPAWSAFINALVPAQGAVDDTQTAEEFTGLRFDEASTIIRRVLPGAIVEFTTGVSNCGTHAGYAIVVTVPLTAIMSCAMSSAAESMTSLRNAWDGWYAVADCVSAFAPQLTPTGFGDAVLQPLIKQWAAHVARAAARAATALARTVVGQHAPAVATLLPPDCRAGIKYFTRHEQPLSSEIITPSTWLIDNKLDKELIAKKIGELMGTDLRSDLVPGTYTAAWTTSIRGFPSHRYVLNVTVPPGDDASAAVTTHLDALNATTAMAVEYWRDWLAHALPATVAFAVSRTPAGAGATVRIPLPHATPVHVAGRPLATDEAGSRVDALVATSVSTISALSAALPADVVRRSHVHYMQNIWCVEKPAPAVTHDLTSSQDTILNESAMAVLKARLGFDVVTVARELLTACAVPDILVHNVTVVDYGAQSNDESVLCVTVASRSSIP